MMSSREGDSERVVSAIDTLISLDPAADFGIWIQRAMAQYSMGRIQDSIAGLDAGLIRFPENIALQDALSRILSTSSDGGERGSDACL